MSFAFNLLNKLRAGKVSVKFDSEKKGVCEMVATLNPDLMPEDKRDTPEKSTPSFVTVWSVDRKGWRNISFRNLMEIDGIPV